MKMFYFTHATFPLGLAKHLANLIKHGPTGEVLDVGV